MFTKKIYVYLMMSNNLPIMILPINVLSACSLYLHLPKPRALSTIAFRQRTPLNILSKRRRTLLLLFPYCLSALLLSNYYNPSHGLHAL